MNKTNTKRGSRKLPYTWRKVQVWKICSFSYVFPKSILNSLLQTQAKICPITGELCKKVMQHFFPQNTFFSLQCHFIGDVLYL